MRIVEYKIKQIIFWMKWLKIIIRKLIKLFLDGILKKDKVNRLVWLTRMIK
jgi:hypothetical protein